MNKFAFAALSILLLSACGQQPAAAPQAASTASSVQAQGYWPLTQAACDAAGWTWSNATGCSD